MNTNNPKDDFLARWLDGQLLEEEVQAWGASGELKGLTQVVEETSRLSVPATKTKEKAWEEFQNRLQKEATPSTPARVVQFPRRSLWISLAAACAAILLVMYLFYPQQNKISNPNGAEPLAHVLPDESSALLNAGSKLTYSDDWDDERQVALRGEAFFQVKKGSRFLVQTDHGNVQVLGTSFNVFVRNGRLEVECFSGKVQVQGADVAAPTILLAGESVMIEDGQVLPSSQSITDGAQPGWIEGRFDFQNAPFSRVMEEVERQFQVEISVEIEGMEDEEWSGAFFNDNLKEALEMICDPMDLTYIQTSTTQIQLIHKP